MMYRVLLLLSMTLLIGACSTELAIPLPFEGERLVIRAIFSAGDTVTVSVDHTYPPTGEYRFSEGVTNATIYLYEGTRRVDTLRRVTKNKYQADPGIRPVPGQTYWLRVEAPGYPTVESQPETIPAYPDIAGATLDKKDRYTLSVTVQDTPNTRNQYEIRLIGYYQRWETGINADNLSRPDAIDDNCGFRGNRNAFFYRDLCFENRSLTTRYGSDLTGTPQFEADSLRGTIKGNPVAERLVVRVRSVSEGYLNYYAYRSAEDIEQAFAQPASRYTNLKGGYGIVLAYAEKSVVLAVP